MGLTGWLGGTAWTAVTRFGEGPFLLPVALLVAAWWCRRPATRQVALLWLPMLTLAAGLTLASKLAFLGWGLGVAALDFTGVSGHSLVGAAVYPVLFGGLVAQRWRVAAAGMGCVLAALIGLSRLAVHVHSVSEVVAGLALGTAVSLVVLLGARSPQRWIGPAVPAAMLAWLWLWFGSTPSHGPASPSIHAHTMVVNAALQLSGRAEPFTRCDLHGVTPAAVQDCDSPWQTRASTASNAAAALAFHGGM